MNTFSAPLGRVVAALLLAGGVALLTAGLLGYAPPLPADPATGAPSGLAGDPLLATDAAAPSEAGGGPTAGSSPSGPGSATFPPSPLATLPPSPLATLLPSPQPEPSLPEASPGASPSPAGAVATRVVIPSLRIDLPIVSGEADVPGNRDGFPLCDVAQYLVFYVNPGQPGTSYIYAHAQRGMFLPLLRASQRDDGAELIDALVEVYTADAKLHLYEIFVVKRHATDLTLADDVPPGEHRLVLQTSEGRSGHIPKLQVAARPIGILPADPEEANPTPSPRACPPG